MDQRRSFATTSRPTLSPALGALLAGGSSRRMGTPKAALLLDGRSLAAWSLRALSAAAPETVQIGGDCLEDVAIPIWPDHKPDCGPIGGLETALVAATGRPVVVCAIDMPFVPAALLRRALCTIRNGALAAVPRWRGRWHPLCAAYAPDMLAPIGAWIDAGHRDLQTLLDLVGASPLGASTLLSYGEPEKLLLNVNRPEDLDLARSWI